jgi:small-conductance mechanosensitive channel
LTLGRILATRVVAQSVQEVQEIVDTSAVTGWDILVAIGVLAASWPISALIGRIARRLVRRVPTAPGSAARIVGRTVRGFVVVTGLAVALSLVGVSIGWFTVTIILVIIVAVLTLRPLVENSAAGLLIESRPAFGLGDEIVTNGHTGEVIAITARSTVIQTRDWTRVHVPNTEVLSDAIIVLTAFDRRRSAIDLEVQYSADLAEAKRLLVEAAASVEGVHAEPMPFVRARGFGTATVTLSLRWWHDSDLRSESLTLDGVVTETKRALDAAGIKLPPPELTIRQP